MLELDDIVHLEIAAAAHNSFYIQFVHILHNAGTDHGLFENAYTRNRENYNYSVQFHKAVLNAIESGDEDMAYKHMCSHIVSIKTIISAGE